MNRYWEVKAKVKGKVGELMLYGDISSAQMWGDEITPLQIDSELKALGDINTLNVHICSGGGSVPAGQAIYSLIKRHGASEKVAYIDGLAASISSLIPCACHKTIMPSNAMTMWHKPWGGISGNADAMRQRADVMDKFEETIINAYEEKTGMSREKIAEMMAVETWMTAKEALACGFIDEIEEDMKVAASINGDFLNYGDVKIDTTNFKNFKPETIEMYRGDDPEPVANNEGPETPNLSAQNAEFHALKLKLLGGQ